MKQYDFENQFQGFSKELFSFAMALIPNREKALNLVVDAYGALMLEKKAELKSIINGSDPKIATTLIQEFKKNLYRFVYNLARKKELEKEDDLKSIDPMEQSFFRVDLLNRAIIYLKFKTEFDFYDFEDIFSLSRHEVISRLTQARCQLGEYYGVTDVSFF